LAASKTAQFVIAGLTRNPLSAFMRAVIEGVAHKVHAGNDGCKESRHHPLVFAGDPLSALTRAVLEGIPRQARDDRRGADDKKARNVIAGLTRNLLSAFMRAVIEGVAHKVHVGNDGRKESRHHPLVFAGDPLSALTRAVFEGIPRQARDGRRARDDKMGLAFAA